LLYITIEFTLKKKITFELPLPAGGGRSLFLDAAAALVATVTGAAFFFRGEERTAAAAVAAASSLSSSLLLSSTLPSSLFPSSSLSEVGGEGIVFTALVAVAKHFLHALKN